MNDIEKTEQGFKSLKALDAIRDASLAYHDFLIHSTEAEHARDYLVARGMTLTDIETFKVGYAPEGWHNISDMLDGFYQEEALILAGLVKESERTKDTYDAFRDRITFPIRDEIGIFVGIGARAIKDGQKPKYINSQQSGFFDKSRLLYNLDQASTYLDMAFANAIEIGCDPEREIIVFEGYTDVIAAGRHSVLNAVAQMGTALTSQNAAKLAENASETTFCLDRDLPGIKSAMRGIEQIFATLAQPSVIVNGGRVRKGTQLNHKVCVMVLPDGDADSTFRSDPEVWFKAHDNRMPFWEFLTRMTNHRAKCLPEARRKKVVSAYVMPFINMMPIKFERLQAIQYLAEQIDARTNVLTRIDTSRGIKEWRSIESDF